MFSEFYTQCHAIEWENSIVHGGSRRVSFSSREGKHSRINTDEKVSLDKIIESSPKTNGKSLLDDQEEPEIENKDELKEAYQDLEVAGVKVKWGTDKEIIDRRVTNFFSFFDPSGNCFDLCARPQKSTRRYFPTRDAGITEFSHVGLKTTNAPRDEIFWTTYFNIRPNDWIGDAALLSFDSLHHRIALFPADNPGIQHINFQVDSIDDVMRSFYFLSSEQVRIVFGPCRHATSGAMFLYFEGPDGMVYEYSNGVRIINDPNYRPRQYPFTPEAFCVWGAKPDIPEFRD